MARTKPNAVHTNGRNKKGNARNKNANNAERTPNSRTPMIQTAPAVKGTPTVKSCPIKHAPAIKSLATMKSSPRKTNHIANNHLGTPSTPKVIDLSAEYSDCEIQRVVTLSGQEKKSRQELARKEVAESPMMNKRIKIEIPPSKPRQQPALLSTHSNHPSLWKNKSVQNTPETELLQPSVSDHVTTWKDIRGVSEKVPATTSKDNKAMGKRKANVSIDLDNVFAHNELQVDEARAARDGKRQKNERKAKRRAEKKLKQEQDRSQTAERVKDDENAVRVYSTVLETNDLHLARDVQDNEYACSTQQQIDTSPTKKSQHEENKQPAEQTANAPKSDGEFMQQLWGVIKGFGGKSDAKSYESSESDCILDEQASTPRKGIRTVTRKIKIETAAANKPSPRFIRSTLAPPPVASPEASPCNSKSALGASSNSLARIDDDPALVRFHFETIQSHIAALRYLSRTRNMQQQQVQEGFHRLVRSIPRLPPPLFGKKKETYVEVESGANHEGLDKDWDRGTFIAK